MAQTPMTYRKIAGNEFSVVFKHYLWQGIDHFLYVERAIFQEQYSRFYFKDIETLVLLRTSRRTAWALVLGAFLLLFAAIVVFSNGVAYFSIFMTALLAILMVVQWLKGPGCEVYLQTAVQKYKLSNLVRIPKAIKVMDRIRAEVEAVQGPLGEQAISDMRFSGMPAEMGAIEKGAENRPADANAQTAVSYRLRVHWILYGLLLFFGLVRGAQLWLKSVPLAVTDMLALACTLVLAIIAVARIRGRERGSLLSLSAWLTLVFTMIHAAVAYGIFIAAATSPRESIYDNWGVLKKFFLLLVDQQPVLKAIAVGVALISIVLGVLGLTASLIAERNRPARMRPKPPPQQDAN